MASIIRTVEARPYDVVYDPVYTSSAMPHTLYRQAAPAMTRGGPQTLEGVITGTNRYKYFKRPIVPLMQAVPPEVMMDVGAMAPAEDLPAAAAPESGEDLAPEGKTHVGIQTMYRESFAQTDPYTPEYILKPGQPDPDVLALQNLTFANGLPAGVAEVELIDRIRQKQDFERSLPPMTDEASFELRRRMMEEQEMLEWAQREAEIDRQQAERLAALQNALDARDRENEFVQEQRIEELRQRKMAERDRAVAAIQRQRVVALRKLGKTRQAMTATNKLGTTTTTALRMGAGPRQGGNGTKRDIIADYANYGSKVYAPVTRLGQHPDRVAVSALDSAIAATNNLEQLQKLEQTLPASVMQARTSRPKPKAARGQAERLDRTIAADLERVDAMLRTRKLETVEPTPAAELPAWRQRTTRVVRPPTPTTDPLDIDQDNVQAAILLLQKLLRGRAVQNMMFAGKERRAELIAELREDDRFAQQDAEREDAAKAQRVAKALAAAEDTMQGEVMAATLDFMAKELVRVHHVQRIASKASAADKVRRERESEEAGRRQAEDAVRSKQDIVFRQLQRVHNQTADSFIDSLLSDTVELAAYTEATRETYVKKSIIAPVVEGLEARQEPSGVVVKDLVASFLMPEVERQLVQEQVTLEEQKYVAAARDALEQVVSAVEGNST